MRISIMFALFLIAATAKPIHAEGGCNEFLTTQSILLAEGAYQPLSAKIEMARVVVTHGPCNVDAGFYSAYGLAQFVHDNEPSHCLSVWVCRAFYMLDTIDPAIRESAAVASDFALRESPRVPRYHFFSIYDHVENWLCPLGYQQIGEIIFC